MWEMGETLKRREGSCSVSFRHVQKVQRSALRLWLAVNTVGSDDAWGLMKLNFPVGASAAVFAWMPLCLYAPWPGFHAFFLMEGIFTLLFFGWLFLFCIFLVAFGV